MAKQPASKRTPATIYDVAERAGVSIATVSHALNRPEKVSDATRTKVMDVVDELQFVPKAAAVSHARRGVGRIGVVAPFTSYSSYSVRLAGVLSGFAESAVDVVVFDHPSVAAASSPLLSALPTTGRLDALLIMGIPLDEAMAQRLRSRRMPTVLVDSYHEEFPTVNVDDELGGLLLGRHLVQRGHQRIAYVAEQQASPDYLSPGQRRVIGVGKALAEADLPGDALGLIFTETADLAGGRAAADTVASTADRPTALVAHHDHLAAGLLAGLREAQVSVPGDVAVAGYDGSELADALGLTTMRQPLGETGYTASRLLREAIDTDGDAPVRHVMLVPELIQGETT
ncbi:LacI family DNA-binding transcriptional regulator [Nakamurella aerolata]|uniref:LacI family DNA-binding transcriptional regulator n=1 Tax=Nakamurella aerolata TaxID=1656892 RepID=A0A849AAX0_9ACTN|nr:LacI family DNA-binding transcriptional regulator [Nakamurella aerolata]NNG36726.1 LacI family DNA-binding transcriptional regulator [Nakamurella aerolata]